jgi:hypothetical protein
MKHVNKYRDNYNGESFYYPASAETVGAIQCKQGEHADKWFVPFDENFKNRTDLQPTEGEDIYILLNISETMFNEPIIIEDVQEENEG